MCTQGAKGGKMQIVEERPHDRREVARKAVAMLAQERRVFVIDGCCTMSSLLAWRKVHMASGGSLPFCTRWQTAGIERTVRFAPCGTRICCQSNVALSSHCGGWPRAERLFPLSPSLRLWSASKAKSRCAQIPTPTHIFF